LNDAIRRIRLGKKPKKHPTGLSKVLLRKKAGRAFRGYPIATIAYYGPDNTFASKVAVGIIREEDGDVDPLERWFSEDVDVRIDDRINQAILKFINHYSVKSLAMTEGILGCPHEEGKDYPQGDACPECPYWTDRNRWAGSSESVVDEPESEDLGVGMAWYRREQYDRLLEIAEDREILEATYDEWLENAETNLTGLREEGIHFEKVDVDVEKLLLWCNEQGHPIDGDTRVKYVLHILTQKSQG
jgi:hypothetical protein